MIKLYKLMRPYRYFIGFSLVLLLACIIRLAYFPSIPAGFNQDEAALGYDSYSLLHYGVDRNGYAFPVYPVSWGAGQGPFYLYFCIPFIALFGNTVFAFRIGNALLGIVAVICFYIMLKQSMAKRYALFGMLLLAIVPWHVFLSRWALDANPLPSLFIIFLCFLFCGIKQGKSRYYILSVVFLTFCIYCYGAAWVVIPLFLLLTMPYLLYHKKINWKTLILCIALFIVLCIPMFLFLLVNYAGFPEIRASFFSVPKLTVMRNESVFRTFETGLSDLTSGIKDYILMVFWQKPDFPWNSVEGFGVLYPISLPFILGGLGCTIWIVKLKQFCFEYIYLVLFIAASVLGILIQPNINRGHIIFVPIICFMVISVKYASRCRKWITILCFAAYLVCFCIFSRYYLQDYNKEISQSFYESFDEALKYTTNHSGDAQKIYVTPDVNGGYLLVLYFTGYSPLDFANTVEYYDKNAEFRQALSFGQYIFQIPEEIKTDASYIVPINDVAMFDENYFKITKFKNYASIIPSKK